MNIKLIAGLMALPMLAACAPEIESTIYVEDLIAVASTPQAISVPAILRVPQSSEDSCNEGLKNLIANLGALAPVTGKAKCIEKDGDQLAEIETQMVISTPAASIRTRTSSSSLSSPV